MEAKKGHRDSKRVLGDQDATECGFEILPHPPYTPDMAPTDVYLFPKLDSHLRGTQYESKECFIVAVNEYLRDQEKAFYFEGIRKLEQRWAKCIALKRFILKSNVRIFHSLVARSTRGGKLFDHPS